MPTYDYRCENCDNLFEEFHGMTEDPVVLCPVCGSPAKKMIGGGLGVIFKGSGFYVNDNRSHSLPSTSLGAPSKEKHSATSTESAGTNETASPGVSAEKKEPAKSAVS